MKVTIDIPKSQLKGCCAILNMQKGKLTDEMIEDIVNTEEVDITEVIKRSGDQELNIALGMVAIGVVGEQKYPNL